MRLKAGLGRHRLGRQAQSRLERQVDQVVREVLVCDVEQPSDRVDSHMWRELQRRLHPRQVAEARGRACSGLGSVSTVLLIICMVYGFIRLHCRFHGVIKGKHAATTMDEALLSTMIPTDTRHVAWGVVLLVTWASISAAGRSGNTCTQPPCGGPLHRLPPVLPGRPGTQGPQGLPGAQGPPGPSLDVPPLNRGLFVDVGGPLVGADGSIDDPFPTIQEALTFANTQGPTTEDPVVLYLSPGTWSESFVLISNVHLIGTPPKSTIIDGALAWFPGFLENAAQVNRTERIVLAGLTITTNLVLGQVAKTDLSAATEAVLMDVDIELLSMVGRGAPSVDQVQIAGASIIHEEMDVADCQPVLVFNTRFDEGVLVAGDSQVVLDSVRIMSGLVMATDTSSLSLYNSRVEDATSMVADDLGIVFASTSAIEGSITVPVLGGAFIDIRSSFYIQPNLVGAGAVARSFWRTEVFSSLLGTNTVLLQPPYLNNLYVVTMTAVGSSTPVSLLVTTKTTSSFDFVDPIGGNRYAVLVSLV